jgi:hypothetical protein
MKKIIQNEIKSIRNDKFELHGKWSRTLILYNNFNEKVIKVSK